MRRNAMGMACRSVELQADSLDHLAADLRLGADECGELLRRLAGRRLDPGGGELLAHACRGSARSTISSCSLSTISGGVFAGATTLCQMPRSKPGKVSATVGISGASEMRCRR